MARTGPADDSDRETTVPEGTNARIESISEFATQVQPLATDFAKAAGDELTAIASARIGSSGTREGGAAMQSHQIVTQLMAVLNNDATIGVLALSTGAQTIAANYLTADAQQEEDMGVVYEAFAPAPGKGMQAAIAEQQQQAAAGSDGPPPVAVDGADVELPEATTEGPAEPSQSSQDNDRLDANREAFGEDEAKGLPQEPTIMAPGPLDGTAPSSGSGTVSA